MMCIIGVCPGQSFKPSFAVQQGKVRIYSSTQIDSVGEVFTGSQHESFVGQNTGVQIDPSLSVPCMKLLDAIRCDFDIRQAAWLHMGFKR